MVLGLRRAGTMLPPPVVLFSGFIFGLDGLSMERLVIRTVPNVRKNVCMYVCYVRMIGDRSEEGEVERVDLVTGVGGLCVCIALPI
jgi:hypothetical protein